MSQEEIIAEAAKAGVAIRETSEGVTVKAAGHRESRMSEIIEWQRRYEAARVQPKPLGA